MAPISESIFYAWTGFPDAARRVDAVVYLHGDDILDEWPWPAVGCASVVAREVRATAISVAKASAGAPVPGPGAFHFVWPQYPPANEATLQFDTKGRWPLRPGMDYIVFLNWVPKADRYTLLDGGLGVPVNGGKLSWVVGKDRSAEGKEVMAFMAEMRAFAAR